MTPGAILLLSALAALVLLGARTGFGRGPLPVVLRPLVESGTVFIVLGALLGPFGLNLFTDALLSQLSPVIVIGLGWIGFLYGSHFEWRLLRRYPAALYGAAATEALLVCAAVGALAWLLLSYWLAADLPPAERLVAAGILGICASGTAPAGVFQLAGRTRLRPDDQAALRFLSTVDDLPGIVLLGLLAALLHPQSPGPFSLQTALWLLASVAGGVGLGFIAHWLFPTGDDARRNSLVLLAIVSLGAGAAAMLRLSPLFVTALCGLTFANLSPRKEQAYGLLVQSEHTLYTVFLLVAGLLFRLDWGPLLVLVPAYLLSRAAAKLGGGYVAGRLLLRGAGVSPYLGAGLLFQGGLTLAMAVSFQQAYLGPLHAQVTTTVVLGAIAFELIAPPLVGAVLTRRRR